MKVHVKVKPNALEDKVERLSDGSYLIYTREGAVDGKANLSVIKIIAREFGVSFKCVLIKNSRSRKKVIEIIMSKCFPKTSSFRMWSAL